MAIIWPALYYQGGKLISAVKASIVNCLNIETELSTSGGTSDGRFIAPTGSQVVELGPRNESIHKINESVRVSDLDKLSKLYKRIILKISILIELMTI